MLILAAALPLLFVDAAPDAANVGPEVCVAVPANRAEAWTGRCATPVDTAGLTKLPTPGVRYRMNEARATSAPWVDSNGAQFLRRPKGRFLITAAEGKAALAAAEASAFGVEAAITATPKDRAAFTTMQQFLKTLPKDDLPALANFGFLDDGSTTAVENMNLLLRRNLLFRIGAAGDSKLEITVKPQDGDPSAFAYELRQKIGDDKRLLRVYGSEVVIARLWGNESRRRVALLQYGNRPAEGVRVRVLGYWPQVKLFSPGGESVAADVVADKIATEFSLPKLTVYAVAELSR